MSEEKRKNREIREQNLAGQDLRAELEAKDWPSIPAIEQIITDASSEYISVAEAKDVLQMAKDIVRIFAAYIPNPKNYSFARMIDAIQFAFKAHLKQRRASGEPYIIHPYSVALNLTELKVDEDTIIAALLHDTVEDTSVSLHDITTRYGQKVSKLVDGVTKLKKITYNSKEELQAENFRKMFLAMAEDIRVVLIKLADRLHNMRTLEYMPRRKQERIARETADIYAPLAARLGIYKWKWELEDLCLKFLEPSAYQELAGAIAQKRSEREEYLDKVMVDLKESIDAVGITAEIEGRPKHLYSIYKKMKTKHKHLNEIYDLFACRVIVDTVTECYACLGIVHEKYKPMAGRFKDYISVPKSNGYQSLHTTVIGPEGIPFEVQIRTHEMHQQAEYGVAAHWRYKAGDNVSKKAIKTDKKLSWLRQLLDWQQDMKNSTQYMEELREGLIEDEVYVFTPKGDVLALPEGSTSIDFAYKIHSEVGHHMYGARVNDKLEPLDYQLENGDVVEILTSDQVKGPSRDWLSLVKTNTAKNKINHWFKQESKEDAIKRGREEVKREIHNSGFVALQLLRSEFLEPILKRYSFNNVDDMYAAIGQNNSGSGISAQRIVPKLRDEYIKSLPEEERRELGYRIGDRGQVIYSPVNPVLKKAQENAEKGIDKRVEVAGNQSNEYGIIVEGIDNCLMNLGNCCNPVPGDDIIGYVTRGNGVTVHRKDCNNVKKLVDIKEGNYEGDVTKKEHEEVARLINVYWDPNAKDHSYKVPIVITARDRSGLLLDISNAIQDENVDIISGQMNSVKGITAKLHLTLEVLYQEQYDRVIGRIKAIKDVADVRRDDL